MIFSLPFWFPPKDCYNFLDFWSCELRFGEIIYLALIPSFLEIYFYVGGYRDTPCVDITLAAVHTHAHDLVPAGCSHEPEKRIRQLYLHG